MDVESLRNQAAVFGSIGPGPSLHWAADRIADLDAENAKLRAEVERLQRIVGSEQWKHDELTRRLLREARERIAVLEAELAGAKKIIEYGDMMDAANLYETQKRYTKQMELKVAALEAALEPFAKCRAIMSAIDPTWVYGVTKEHFSAAAGLLAPSEKQS